MTEPATRTARYFAERMEEPEFRDAYNAARAEIDGDTEHGTGRGSWLFTPTDVHVCDVPKGTEPLTVWLCDCGKYWAYKKWLFLSDGFCEWAPVTRNHAVRLITRAKKKANR